MKKTYTELFRTYRENIRKHCADALDIRRDEAAEAFEQGDFPAENYRNIPIRKCYEPDYGLNLNRIGVQMRPDEIFRCNVGGIEAHTVTMVNDTFVPNAQNAEFPEGVVACGLNEAAAKFPDLVKKHLHTQTDFSDPNVALNAMFAQDGFFLYVPDNVVVEKPVQLLNLMYGKSDLMAVSHNLIVVGKNARLQMLVCDHTTGNAKFLSNRITEVFVDENASYEHYKVEHSNPQASNICHLSIRQKASSRVLGNIITLNNGTTRNNVSIDLCGEGAEAQLYGIGIGNNAQLIDNFTTIRHSAANCTSRELFKYILKEQSRGVFCGKIHVLPDAQKTVALQTNKNICLSRDARMFTKPQLEIYADDVQCSHGATTGQLDEDALFYLQARGIGQREARLLLMLAFASDITEHLYINGLKERVNQLVEARLKNDGNRCANCSICK